MHADSSSRSRKCYRPLTFITFHAKTYYIFDIYRDLTEGYVKNEVAHEFFPLPADQTLRLD